MPRNGQETKEMSKKLLLLLLSAASALNCFKIQTSLYSISTVECKIISKFQ